MSLAIRSLFVVVVLVSIVSSSPRARAAETRYRIVSASMVGSGTGDVRVEVTSDQMFSATALAIAYDSAVIEATSIFPLVDADFFVGEIHPGGGITVRATTAVGAPWAPVLDAPWFRIGFESLYTPPLAEVTPLQFVDAAFGVPPVSNLIVIDGEILGVAEGLELIDGSVTVLPPEPNRLLVADRNVVQGSDVLVPIRASNPSGPLAGFVVAVTHDTSGLDLLGISLAGTATQAVGAEFIDMDLQTSGTPGGTLAVLFDFEPPYADQTIPVGVNHTIAYFEYHAHAVGLAPDETAEYAIEFVDGAMGTPAYDNLLAISGLPDYVAPDLVSGTVTVFGQEPPHVAFWCGPRDLTLDGTGTPISDPLLGLRGGETEACFFYTSNENVQGFQLVACFDCDLTLSDFTIADSIVEAVGAEFVNWQIDNDPYDGDGCEFVAGILLDALPPFEGQTLPPTDQPLLIGCVKADIPDAPPCARDLEEQQGKMVDFIVAGPDFSLAPGADVEVDPFIATPGEELDVCFWYRSEFEIQGFQLSLAFDCDLIVGDFSLAGSMPELVGAEYVNFSYDFDPDDGDGCEFVGGILLDLFPPFEGQTVPATDVPLLIGCLPVTVPVDAPCESIYSIEFVDFLNGGQDGFVENIAVVDFGSFQDIGLFCNYILVEGPEPCDKLALTFCDFVDGTGGVPVENIAVIDYQSIQDIDKFPCEICLIPVRRFRRGDCNVDGKWDLADSASILGEQFFDIESTCLDACDANDDGKINLADSVLILHYTFDSGATPPSPFPDCGFDPTDDGLDCDSYTEC